MRAEEIDSYRRELASKKLEKQSIQDAENHAMPNAPVDGDVHMQESDTTKHQENRETDLMDTAVCAEPGSEEEVKNFWIQKMTSTYNASMEELKKRRQYLDCIKRPYFHVKPYFTSTHGGKSLRGKTLRKIN